MARTRAEILADRMAVERALNRAQQKADHYNATVRHLEVQRKRLATEEADLPSLLRD